MDCSEFFLGDVSVADRKRACGLYIVLIIGFSIYCSLVLYNAVAARDRPPTSFSTVASRWPFPNAIFGFPRLMGPFMFGANVTYRCVCVLIFMSARSPTSHLVVRHSINSGQPPNMFKTIKQGQATTSCQDLEIEFWVYKLKSPQLQPKTSGILDFNSDSNLRSMHVVSSFHSHS